MVTKMTQAFLSETSLCVVFLDVHLFLSAILVILALGRFFMENQVMGQFVRILKISRTMIVSLQLLQTMSIMIQNLKSEHAICKFVLEERTFFFFFDKTWRKNIICTSVSPQVIWILDKFNGLPYCCRLYVQ